MKNKLSKLNNKILMSGASSNRLLNNLKQRLHLILNYILYPEFRKHRDIKKVLYDNRYLIISIKSIIILFTLTFFFGKSVNDYLINHLKKEVVKKDSVIGYLNLSLADGYKSIRNLSIELRSRNYLEYKVVKEANIEFVDNLREVPDSIFFLMVNEADKYKIPYKIFFRIMEIESKFQFVVNGESGATGYMQVMPYVFTSYHDKLNLSGGHTFGNNIRVSANLIDCIRTFWLTKFKSDKKVWEYTLAEYNCGREPMKIGESYHIPQSVLPYVEYVMCEYK